MQAFFRSWDEVDRGEVRSGFIDPSKVETAWELISHLTEQPPSGVAKLLRGNLGLLHEMAAEIVGVARTDHPELARPKPVRAWDGKVTHLGHVYQAVGAGRTNQDENEPASARDHRTSGRLSTPPHPVEVRAPCFSTAATEFQTNTATLPLVSGP